MRSYRVLLSNPQRSAVPSVPPQKKSAQIGRLAADNRKQLRVCAAWAGKTLQDTG